MAEKILKFSDAPSYVNTGVPGNYWEDVFREWDVILLPVYL
jgi:hypothetical protein